MSFQLNLGSPVLHHMTEVTPEKLQICHAEWTTKREELKQMRQPLELQSSPRTGVPMESEFRKLGSRHLPSRSGDAVHNRSRSPDITMGDLRVFLRLAMLLASQYPPRLPMQRGLLKLSPLQATVCQRRAEQQKHGP